MYIYMYIYRYMYTYAYVYVYIYILHLHVFAERLPSQPKASDSPRRHAMTRCGQLRDSASTDSRGMSPLRMAVLSCTSAASGSLVEDVEFGGFRMHVVVLGGMGQSFSMVAVGGAIGLFKRAWSVSGSCA